MYTKGDKGLGLWWLLVLIVGLLVVGAVSFWAWQRYVGSTVQQQSPVAVQQGLNFDDKVKTIVDDMSLQEKIGQMIMMGMNGRDVNPETAALLHDYHVGGIILYDKNMVAPSQVRSLTRRLQEEANEKIPLYIAVDEAGCIAKCVRGDLPTPPSAQSLGEANKPNEAEQWAFMTSRHLRDMGINVNLAPVADLGTEDEGYYSDSPTVVTTFVNAAAMGYEHGKVMYALKYFPGQGRAEHDSDHDVSVVKAPQAEIMKTDLMPFRDVIASRNEKNYFILLSHSQYWAFDGHTPASLSKYIISELLRKQLGFHGVVMTDDLAKGAIRSHYSMDEAAVMAVKAGADVLFISKDPSDVVQAYKSIYRAVTAGEISEGRINASVLRIVRMKLANLEKPGTR